MLIGDASAFAVQCDLSDPKDHCAPHGRLCFSAGGLEIGDFTQPDFLFSVTRDIRIFLDQEYKVVLAPLPGGSDQEKLDRAQKAFSENARNAAHVWTPRTPNFEGYFGIIERTELGDKIIWVNKWLGQLNTLLLPAQTVHYTLREFIHAYDRVIGLRQAE